MTKFDKFGLPEPTKYPPMPKVIKMNERIRDLTEQAAGDFTENFKWDYLPEIDKDIFEKFAQLIVRECIKLSQPQVEYPVDGTWIEKSYWEGCYDSSKRIKEHFGVDP